MFTATSTCLTLTISLVLTPSPGTRLLSLVFLCTATAYDGNMSGGKKRSRLLVCSVCLFETHSKGGFAWHQTSTHGRLHGNGIPGQKRAQPCTPDGDDAAAAIDDIPARPLARRRLRRVAEGGPRSSRSAPPASAPPAEEAEEAEAPGPASAVRVEATAGLGALVADDAGCYDAAIRAQLYPVPAMTGASVEGNEGVGGGAARDAAGDPTDVHFPYESLATRVFRLYEVLDDAARAVPITERRKNSRSGRFNTARLRALQQFVLGVGGAGLSVREQRLLYDFLEVWDSRDSADPLATNDRYSLQAVFPTISSFTSALRDDLVDAVLDAGWKKLSIREGGTVYEVYYRSVLEVVMATLRKGGACLRLWSGEGGPAPPTNRRETPMDGDAFRLCERDVVDKHGASSFVLGLHLYSDSCRLSWSGGKFCVMYGCVFLCALWVWGARSLTGVSTTFPWSTADISSLLLRAMKGVRSRTIACSPFNSAHKLYPVRARLVNDVSGEIEWMTIAYIPLVRIQVEPAAQERSRLRRCGILQRVLYVCMRTAMAASRFGAEVRVNGRLLMAFPRVLLYVCDQPEERAVLCMKAGKCQRPCSQCDVQVDVAGSSEALNAAERDVVETLERQLEAAGHRSHNRERARRETLEAVDSLTGFVPALAAMDGLSTAPYLMYKMIGFDALHVRSAVPGASVPRRVCNMLPCALLVERSV